VEKNGNLKHIFYTFTKYNDKTNVYKATFQLKYS